MKKIEKKIKEYLLARYPMVEVPNEKPREEWIEKTLATIPECSRILDAGAGTQRYKRFCGHLNYVSQDFGEYDGEGDSSGLQTGEFDYGKLDIVCDIVSIPEPDASFDAIMCIEVLEHLPDPSLAVKEFARLLKPGGHLIITAPFASLTHFAPYHFCSGFNRYWYERHLGDNGFSLSDICANGNYFNYLAQELHRIPSVSPQYAKSKPGFLEKLGLGIVQKMLLNHSLLDSGSSEMLCFGYHVHARKDQN